MGKGRMRAALLALLLMLSLCLPALALEGETPPTKPPEEHPYPFSAHMYWLGGFLDGTFPALSDQMEWVAPYYSWDGREFSPCLDNWGDPWYWDLDWDYGEDGRPTDEDALTQSCMNSWGEPMLSFMAGEKDAFYLQLRFQLRDTEEILESETDYVFRPIYEGVPEGVEVRAHFDRDRYGPADIRPPHPKQPPQYNVTVRRGTTPEELDALLPDAIPITVWLCKAENGVEETLGKFNMDYPVAWTLPTEVITGDLSIENAALFTPPKDVTARTADAIYHLAELPEVAVPADFEGILSNRLTLMVNTVETDVKAPLELYDDGYDTVCAYFPQKPSGATAVVPAYSLDGGKTWIESTPALMAEGLMEAFPKSPDNRSLELFATGQSPNKEYLSGALDGFLVRVEIEGGSLAGQSITKPWPSDYQPSGNNPDVEDPDGSGGNNGNAGSGNNSGSSNGGGQRPGLPEEPPEPEVTPTPTPTPTPEPVPEPTPEPTTVPEPVPMPAPETPPPLLEHPPKETAAMAPVQTVRPPPSSAVPEPTPTPIPEPTTTPKPTPSVEAEGSPSPSPTSEAASPPTPPPPRETAEESLPGVAIAAGAAVLAGGAAVILYVKKKVR